MGAGALSDDRVVEASKKVVPILVDCTQRGPHAELTKKYGVGGYPTIVFVNSAGEQTATMSSREPAALAGQIQSAAGTGAGSASSGGAPASAPSPSGGQASGGANGGGGVSSLVMFFVAGVVSLVIVYFFLRLLARK